MRRRAGLALVLVALLAAPLTAQTIDVAQWQAWLNQILSTVQAMQAALPPPVVVPPTVPIVRVPLGGNLQAALDAVTGPVEIRVAPGTYSGNFVLRNKAIPAGAYVTLRPDVADSALTPIGPVPWITPAQSVSFVKLKSPNTEPSLSVDDGAHGYRLLGLEGFQNTAWPDRDLWVLGRWDATSVAQLPYDIIIDRCYLHGDPVKGQHRGIAWHVVNGLITGSYLSDFFEPGRQSQAIATWNSPGPLTVRNSFIEGASENLLIGGSDPRIPGLLPSDILVEGNLFHKPLAWKGKGYNVGNLFEVKVGRRIRIRNNVFEFNWPDLHAGAGIVFTVRDQDGGQPWATIDDLRFEFNVVRDVEGPGFNTLGWDDHDPAAAASVQGTRLVIANNLLLRVQQGIQVNRGFEPTTLVHNTWPSLLSTCAGQPCGWLIQFSGRAMPAGMFTFQSNVAPSAAYGITGDGSTAPGKPSLDAMAPGSVFDRNVLEAAPYVVYPVGNFSAPAGTLAGRFDARKRYTGSELGADGVKVGADIDEIMRRIPWAVW